LSDLSVRCGEKNHVNDSGVCRGFRVKHSNSFCCVVLRLLVLRFVCQ